MGNQRFSITPSKAVADLALSDNAYRTLSALGVFGDKAGWCWPSLSTIGKMLGKSKQAVSRDTQELVRLGYLEIYPRYNKESGARRSNLVRIRFDYKEAPDLADPVNYDDTPPSTPEIDTPSTPAVDDNALLNAPIEDKEKAISLKKRKEELLQNASPDWLLASGASSEKIAELAAREQSEKDRAHMYEAFMGYNPLPWWTDKALTRLLKFLLTKPPEEMRNFALWSRMKFSQLSPVKARQNPNLVIEMWGLAQPAPSTPSTVPVISGPDTTVYAPPPTERPSFLLPKRDMDDGLDTSIIGK
jgi:DNA-binding Lrp family transcriptional regulator